MNEIKLPFVVKLPLALLSILALSYILWAGQTIIAPFFLALLFAFLFLPFANFLERKLRFSRGISTLSSVAVVLLGFWGAGYFFSSQLADFKNDIPQLQIQFSETFNVLQEWISRTFQINSDEQINYIDMGMNQLLSSSGQILGVTVGIFTSGFGFLLFFIFFFIFILNYRRILNRFIVRVFQEEHKHKVKEVVAEVRQMTKSYIVGLCIQITIVSLLTFGMLTLVGVKYALLLGILTGLLNVIPYIGVLVSLLISCFIAFATNTPITCLYVILGYGIIHVIDANIVLPFVVGSKVKINALFSFLGILVGEQLWGISGMLLCIPALAILKIIFDHVESLKPWGILLGEEKRPKRAKRKIKVTKKIVFEEKD
ncbi:MAG TPA: AI-2E family transporter [Crocinitomicaceae bacterium]|nr:AI-2E family transporter [Crocinitomicaceae bacterium]